MSDRFDELEKKSLDEKLSLLRHNVHEKSHLIVKEEICRSCNEKYCLNLCPVGNYQLNDKGDVFVSHEGCLECGACRVACERDAIEWSYPLGGYGVCYKYG